MSDSEFYLTLACHVPIFSRLRFAITLVCICGNFVVQLFRFENAAQRSSRQGKQEFFDVTQVRGRLCWLSKTAVVVVVVAFAVAAGEDDWCHTLARSCPHQRFLLCPPVWPKTMPKTRMYRKVKQDSFFTFLYMPGFRHSLRPNRRAKQESLTCSVARSQDSRGIREMARRSAEKLPENCVSDDIVSTLLAVGFEALPHDLARVIDHAIVGPRRVAQRPKRPRLLDAPQHVLARIGGRGRGRGGSRPSAGDVHDDGGGRHAAGANVGPDVAMSDGDDDDPGGGDGNNMPAARGLNNSRKLLRSWRKSGLAWKRKAATLQQEVARLKEVIKSHEERYVKKTPRRSKHSKQFKLSAQGMYRLGLQRTRHAASAVGTAGLLDTPVVRQTVTRCENLLRANLELQDQHFHKQARARVAAFSSPEVTLGRLLPCSTTAEHNPARRVRQGYRFLLSTVWPCGTC